MENYQSNLEAFVVVITEEIRKYTNQRFPNLTPEVLSVHPGKKYDKIVSGRPGSEYGSAYCFIRREDGAILKAGGWVTPAKGVRGYITDANYGWGKAVGPYGAAYLR